MILKDKFDRLVEEGVVQHNFADQLDYVRNHFSKTIFSSSFSYEDQVITHLLKDEDVAFFTLDTGRLFEETYEVWNLTLARYKIAIEAYYPDALAIQEFVSKNGPNSFYRSVEERKSCCSIRKVAPLKKALAGQEIWITGLRAEHSANREHIDVFEWDESNQIIKFHPLLHWHTDEVVAFVKENKIPYNRLHERGYVSIGCAPCTRAIMDGEDFRAGRWWWEESKKECGLHVHADNK